MVKPFVVWVLLVQAIRMAIGPQPAAGVQKISRRAQSVLPVNRSLVGDPRRLVEHRAEPLTYRRALSQVTDQKAGSHAPYDHRANPASTRSPCEDRGQHRDACGSNHGDRGAARQRAEDSGGDAGGNGKAGQRDGVQTGKKQEPLADETKQHAPHTEPHIGPSIVVQRLA